ncbi:F0F1 ATP synthase subunit gamma [Aporhodopirellula aestuarii]|uniref:F0F1 ATP synthase subunit gamma n=1 Tax=Aporhodopirellula aestuarii TaxID=2950107 RepID=A0ABT0U6H5_9BACT|nr:FoF1 ATP synthase subunit gamma [Aporhodopirellula aestuarii]MCM2372552.1 F0F1 ATP synthase subunit gamma [Aporhodopirellula aestuarii]
MKRQQYLQHRLQTLSSLQDAVDAMRSMSAHHFRLARQSLIPARRYRDEMGQIIAEIGVHQPRHMGLPAGMLVVSSDLGLCGDYNSRLSRTASDEARMHSVGTIYSVGRRSRTTLARGGWLSSRTYDAPASLEGLPRLLLGLAENVLEDYMSLKIGSLHVVSASFQGVGHFEPLSVRVLPIEPVAITKPLEASQ